MVALAEDVDAVTQSPTGRQPQNQPLTLLDFLPVSVPTRKRADSGAPAMADRVEAGLFELHEYGAVVVASETSSELGVQPSSDYGDRSTIAVVGRIDDKLIIGARPPTRCEPQAVIGLDALLETGMR